MFSRSVPLLVPNSVSPPFSTGLLLAGLFALGLIGTGCSTPSLPPAHSSNPLPECPSSPNCERLSQDYDVPADTLFDATTQALDALGPSSLELSPDSMRASAVYRVALVFNDDVDVAVDTTANGSRLHVRSASRVGHSDLGVNARRVDRLLRAIDDRL
jgi:uncharacterized protein (DUF1499 family)